MDADLKKILKAVVLEMRHELEGYYDNAGKWFPGDLEQRLAEIGVRKDRESAPADELALADDDVAARKIIDAYISLRQQAGVDRADAVAEYVRESAYTWANRLVALRCMEARELLDDEVIVGREAYGGRSLVHHRLAQTSPELCTGEDDGRFAMLFGVFAERAETLPMLFDPESPSIALRPSPPALKNCLAWLSGSEKVRSHDPATDAVFAAPDALGWAYQYWNTEEKDRVFETVRTKKGAKIEGADIIPATQLYTEDYMVKFLVQNSLGATWMGMHPESRLLEGWEYYVRDADRAPAKKKPLRQITLLDPACGSGHFLIEAFDMFFSMYEEEGEITEPEEICKSILENNLFGIDIDERAIQIAEASLWMKAEEKAFGFSGATTNLVAATSSHLKGESWERYLAKLKKEPSTVRVLRKFAVEMEHIDELGSLARPAEALESIIKEEHELWEKQERERHEADKSLFKEIRDEVLASQLPFQDITDKKFFERTMQHALFAIDGFTAEARESGEFNDQLMGVEAKTGFRLLALLSRKYDVVVANPPYMGSKNMGPMLRAFIDVYYAAGKRDIYAVFMLRAKSFLLEGGRTAIVAPQTWMFLASFIDLRSTSKTILDQMGLLDCTTFEVLAQLGRHAFDEVDPPSNVAMFSFCNTLPNYEHRCNCIRATASRPSIEQADVLRMNASGESNDETFRPNQLAIAGVPSAPFAYWLPERLFKIVSENPQMGRDGIDRYHVRDGMNTGNNERFVRFRWEKQTTGSTWRKLSKGGGYKKWAGNDCYMVRWGRNGEFISSAELQGTRLQNTSSFFKPLLCYTRMARGSLGVRLLDDSAFDGTGLAIDSSQPDERVEIAALLNTRVPSFLCRLFSQSMEFRGGYVERLPNPSGSINSLRKFALSAIECKKRLVASELNEHDFKPSLELCSLDRLRVAAVLHTIEGALETAANECFGIGSCEMEAVYEDTGRPVGLFPLLSTHFTALPDLDIGIQLGLDLREILVNNERVDVDEQQLEAIRKRLKVIYFAGRGAETGDDENPDSTEMSTQVLIRPETFLEELSREMELHPISVYSILMDGIAQDCWISPPENVEDLSNKLTVELLLLLGHRWPTENELGLSVPAYADDDGIIPLTPVIKESVLQERVIGRLKNEDIDLSGFVHVMGKSIEDWLTTEFFKHHIRQFRKRPIAWQLQTSSFTSRKSPAFACLVYYHRVDVDAIPKIRTQYTGPLKLRFETELRGIASTPLANRTDKQAKRAVELEEAITELQTFDEKLAAVAKSGFGPAKLLSKLRQYALDDAILAMKARWLKRLSELLDQAPGEEAADGTRQASPLDQWQGQAIETGLHPELAQWIGEALSNLDYFCNLVGPKAPDAKKTPDDPTVADFAELIRPETVTMQTRSIELACGVWWGKFDAAVLAPIKKRIKMLKAEQKELNAAIKEDRQPVLDADTDATVPTGDTPLLSSDEPSEQTTELTKAAMKARLKEIKAKIKKFTDEMNLKAGKAQAIRDAIQAWNSSEPGKWHDWLAEGPMFDQVASLDDRRSPPKTIAEFIDQESLYAPDINDGVRVNIAPLQKAGVLAADVLAAKDIDKAIADRAEWRADERRWVREGKLPQCGWWAEQKDEGWIGSQLSIAWPTNHNE